ncbi:MAG: hypothetical protein IJE94_07205 [Oscillospiraceae bacterium]|nr:hypothetical protein [Oscillospiraceae bacterium]
MEGFGILLLNVVLTLFAFFAAAPITLSAISTFGVQKQFAQAMVEEGVIAEEEVKRILPKKQGAGLVIAIIVLAALGIAAWRAAPYGPICAVVGFVLGLVKYRKVLQFNSLTVQRFKNTFKDSFDAAKLNRYVDKMF